MNPYWIVVALTALAQFIMFARWLHRRMRDDEMRRAFVRDMAIIHLPHVYLTLGRIAVQLKIDIEKPPPVQFLDLGERDRDR